MSEYQPFILSYLQQIGKAATPENIAQTQRKMDAIITHELISELKTLGNDVSELGIYGSDSSWLHKLNNPIFSTNVSIR